MPFSHLTLTVTNLPSSTSFFLACLQPLGYQFIGRSDEYIGFGQTPGEPADFWITEQKPGYVVVLLPSSCLANFAEPLLAPPTSPSQLHPKMRSGPSSSAH